MLFRSEARAAEEQRAAIAASEDGEAALKWMLSAQTGMENFELFLRADYDGDGTYEAFALAGAFDGYGYTGDLWFVSANRTERLASGCSYLELSADGDRAPILFMAEEWYGGSGSTTHLWAVENGAPVKLQASALEGLEYGGNNEF